MEASCFELSFDKPLPVVAWLSFSYFSSFPNWFLSSFSGSDEDSEEKQDSEKPVV